VQVQVLNLLQDLQDSHGLSYLLVSHDLAVVGLLCDEVIVLHEGRVVERGEPQQVFGDPRHPATRRLVAAVPGARTRAAAGPALVKP
jgi:peptide/nickel transport system ATP-binding protein